MPRRARRSLETCFFHVIVQGINREYIFKKEEYMKKYFQLLLKKSDEYDVKILAYCIMNNHAHFLLFSGNVDALGKCMKSVNTAYAMFYNKHEERVGYVFRDRYLSEPIMSERQLYNCIAYIHYNPVKAEMVSQLENYPFSSYMDYINKIGIVTDEKLILIFGSPHDYLKLFQFIHYGADDCMDVETIADFLPYKNLNKKNKGEIIEKVKELKEMKLSNRKISEVLGIDRNRINKLLKM